MDNNWQSHFPLYLYGDPVSFNGVIHIIASTGEGRMAESEQWVISFHLADEKFIVTPVPNMCGKHLKLRALGDRVCVVGTFGERTSILVT